MKRTYSSLSRSALALATASLVGLLGATASAQSPQQCIDGVRKALPPTMIPAGFATQQLVTAACQHNKGRAAVSLRDIAHRFALSSKLEAAAAAKPEVGKTCPSRITATARALNINPQIANPKEIAGACGAAKGHPPLAARNFLDHFVVTAKLGPSVMAQNNPGPAPKPMPPKPATPQRPDPAMAKCVTLVAQTVKAVAIDPKFAGQKDLETSCTKGKANPQLASFLLLNHFLGSNKITPETKIPDGLAKQCPGRVTSVARGLHLDPPLMDPKRVASACSRTKGHGAIAARDLLGMHLKKHKMI